MIKRHMFIYVYIPYVSNHSLGSSDLADIALKVLIKGTGVPESVMSIPSQSRSRESAVLVPLE